MLREYELLGFRETVTVVDCEKGDENEGDIGATLNNA